MPTGRPETALKNGPDSYARRETSGNRDQFGYRNPASNTAYAADHGHQSALYQELEQHIALFGAESLTHTNRASVG